MVCLTIPSLVQLHRQLIKTTAVCSGTFPIRKSVKYYHKSILVLIPCYLNASIKMDVPNMAVYIFSNGNVTLVFVHFISTHLWLWQTYQSFLAFLQHCKAISKFLELALFTDLPTSSASMIAKISSTSAM